MSFLFSASWGQKFCSLYCCIPGTYSSAWHYWGSSKVSCALGILLWAHSALDTLYQETLTLGCLSEAVLFPKSGFPSLEPLRSEALEGVGRHNRRKRKRPNCQQSALARTLGVFHAKLSALPQRLESKHLLSPKDVVSVFMLFSLSSVAFPVPRREWEGCWATVTCFLGCCHKSPQT